MSSRIARGLALALGLGALIAAPAQGRDWHGGPPLRPGNLLVSESTYSPADIQPGVTQLPPGCTGSGCAPAVADGAFPFVFNNDSGRFVLRRHLPGVPQRADALGPACRGRSRPR